MFNLFKRKIKTNIKSGSRKLIYQNKNGEYLPDALQPDPVDSNIYIPHQSTRYKNVTIGDNGITIIKDEGKNIDTNRKLPELYINKQNCCGCMACYSICMVNAITMESDEEGFYYPTVDASKCICCYKCEHICPIKKKL